MSHSRQPNDTPVNSMSNTSCHTCVVSYTSCLIRHVTYVRESCHTHVTHTSHNQEPNGTVTHVSHATHRHHVTHVSESRHTHHTQRCYTGHSPTSRPEPANKSTKAPFLYIDVFNNGNLLDTHGVQPCTSDQEPYDMIPHSSANEPCTLSNTRLTFLHSLQTDIKRIRAVHTTYMRLI